MGKLFYDLNTTFEAAQKLKIWQSEIISGSNLYDLDFSNAKTLQPLKCGFILLESGNIKFGCEIEETEDLWYSLWLNWLKWKWKDWQAAKIIFDIDGEPPIDEDIDEEIILSGNFLKLYCDAHFSDETRLLILPFPREDLSGEDINAVPVDNILLSRKGFPINKIIRAVYVNKNVIKMTF